MHNDGQGGRRQAPVAGAEVGRQQAHPRARGDVESEQPAHPLEGAEASVTQYLEERVDGAVVHLRRLLPPEELELLKQQLMDQICADPTMSELVQQATGALPIGGAEKE